MRYKTPCYSLALLKICELDQLVFTLYTDDTLEYEYNKRVKCTVSLTLLRSGSHDEFIVKS